MVTRQKIIRISFLISSISVIYGYLLYNKEHTEFDKLEPVAEFSSVEFNKFVTALNQEELGDLNDKVYSINGNVESVFEMGIILDGGIVCTTIDSTSLGLEVGEIALIKGRFVSYDELFGEVRLDHVVSL